jgi:hypothetical protein
MATSLVLTLTCTGSSDRADGTKQQQLVGTSISVNGVADPAASFSGTVISSALLFPTDFTNQVTITI